jgi:phosphoglycolate phosphatase
MKVYAGYLFDLDGTLIDTAPDIGAALNHALARGGFAGVDEALTRHWVGHGSRVLVQQALDRQAAPADALDDVQRAFLDYYERHIADRSTPYPHVIESLRALRGRGARLAVVTNKVARLSVPLLEALDMAKLFDLVVGGDTAARPKPAADPALHACAAIGVDIADTLFVGDSETDVACARAAGCAVVCVRDGYNHGTSAEHLGADDVIDSFRALL